MKVYFAGKPTQGDVRRLLDTFGAPAPGTEIAHEEIERELGVSSKENRYRTVTNAWRKALLDQHNIDMTATTGVGFRVLTSEERIHAGLHGTRQGVRKVIRSVRRSDAVSTDDPVLLKKQSVVHRLGLAMADEFNREVKQIEPPKPQEQNPRRALRAV